MSFRLRSQKVPDVHDTVVIAAGNFTATKTHANKTFANCRLRFGAFYDNNDGSGTFPYIELSQSGSDVVVTATRLGAFTSNCIIVYAVEEYVSHVIKSNQRFVLTDPGLGIAISHTVTQVGTYWSLDALGYATVDNATGNTQNWTMVGSYDGITTVTGTPAVNPGAVTIKASFELVEWY